MSARGGVRGRMGNLLSLVYPSGTREGTVYFDKGRLLQFSNPVPALKLLQENPNHLLVYSGVEKAADLDPEKEIVSRNHVRIQLVSPGDMLQVSRVYFLVHIPEKNPSRFANYFSEKSSSASSPSTQSPSASASGSSCTQLVNTSSTSTQMVDWPSVSALSLGSPSTSPRPLATSRTVIGGHKQKMMQSSKHPYCLLNSENSDRNQIRGNIPSVLFSVQERASSSTTQEVQQRPSEQNPPRPSLPSQDRSRELIQHSNGRSPSNNALRSPRKPTSRPGSRRPVNSRSRISGMRTSPPHPNYHQTRPLVRTVSESVSLEEDLVCIPCCPRFTEERGKRPKRRHPSIRALPDRGGTYGFMGSSPAPSRKPLEKPPHCPASNWRPRLASISENSVSLSADSEKLIPKPFSLPKYRPLGHRRRIGR